MNLSDWKLWIVIIASVLAVSLAFVYPYQPQRQEVLQEYQNMSDQEIIDVIVPLENKDEALTYLAMKYDGYMIIEEYYIDNKKSWFFRLKKEGVKK
ncbi:MULTISPECIES: hypothetical protein [unclassified Marinitoga]|uniref:hypothetical protein n=1 Tax=unclassified Marinitoga TaxID=2640159 RepID=UPI00095053EA|nr:MULTISPECIES: hypothetical protein [unclassified Marinitoga]APT75069.1 hypothetical protein LN42_00660 [Marinitoga sp. 1137]NUU96779.1 hypothetical protein [Marinitoga sp. 1138]